MDTPSSPIQPVEYSCFYAVYGALYSLLAIELGRNPHESVHIVALWVLLERLGYKNIVQGILPLPRAMINDLADEASVYLKRIKDPQFLLSAEDTDIPLTCSLLKKKISLQKIFENQDSVVEGVSNVITEICTTALADVIQWATKRHAANDSEASQGTLLPAAEQSMAQSFANLGFVWEMPNGTNGEKWVSPLVEESLIRNFSELGMSGGLPGGCIPGNSKLPPHEDTTLFVTFSKGYPVRESEVRGFFNYLFGDCIVSFFMQPVRPNEQALYARVEFSNSSIVDAVLNGLPKAKYTINRKHMWMRKYVMRHPTFQSCQFQAPAE